MERLNSGESKMIFRNIPVLSIIGLTTSGRKAWQEEEETRKDTSIVLIPQEQILYLRALQGHSGRSLVDPTLQDNVVIPSDFFQYIFHVGCAINFTFHHQFGIDTWTSKFEQQTDSILSACGSHGQKTIRILIRSA